MYAEVKLYFILFIVYSFIGWIIETSDVWIEEKQLMNRGFLFGPFCPIYGVCSVVMILLLKNVKNLFTLYILCVLICTAAEYATGSIMEKIFNAKWWDYSKNKFNIKGRICLRNCLLFGLAGFLLIRFVNVYVLNIIHKINPDALNIIFYTLFIVFIIDFGTSIRIINSNKMLLSTKKDQTAKIANIKSKQIRKLTRRK